MYGSMPGARASSGLPADAGSFANGLAGELARSVVGVLAEADDAPQSLSIHAPTGHPLLALRERSTFERVVAVPVIWSFLDMALAQDVVMIEALTCSGQSVIFIAHGFRIRDAWSGSDVEGPTECLPQSASV